MKYSPILGIILHTSLHFLLPILEVGFCILKLPKFARHWWFMPSILATLEAEIRRMMVHR
jgi:hypothetical protein